MSRRPQSDFSLEIAQLRSYLSALFSHNSFQLGSVTAAIVRSLNSFINDNPKQILRSMADAISSRRLFFNAEINGVRLQEISERFILEHRKILLPAMVAFYRLFCGLKEVEGYRTDYRCVMGFFDSLYKGQLCMNQTSQYENFEDWARASVLVIPASCQGRDVELSAQDQSLVTYLAPAVVAEVLPPPPPPVAVPPPPSLLAAAHVGQVSPGVAAVIRAIRHAQANGAGYVNPLSLPTTVSSLKRSREVAAVVYGASAAKREQKNPLQETMLELVKVTKEASRPAAPGPICFAIERVVSGVTEPRDNQAVFARLVALFFLDLVFSLRLQQARSADAPDAALVDQIIPYLTAYQARKLAEGEDLKVRFQLEENGSVTVFRNPDWLSSLLARETDARYESFSEMEGEWQQQQQQQVAPPPAQAAVDVAAVLRALSVFAQQQPSAIVPGDSHPPGPKGS